MAKAGLVYVGTNDGMVMLSDPGATGRWRQVGHTLPGMAVQAIQAVTALELVVRTLQGYQRTTDGGQTWEALAELTTLPEPLSDVTLEGAPPARLRTAAVADGRRVVARSVDDGGTWEPATLPADRLLDVVVLAAAQYHPDVAWAGTTGGEVLLSKDRGRTWELVQEGLAPVQSLAAVRLM